MAKNKLKDKLTTGVVTLVWPHLHAKDTRFDDADDAAYKTEFNASPEVAAPIVKKAKAMIREALKKKIHTADPKAPYIKEDDGTFTFKCKTFSEPRLFDAAGEPLQNGLRIGGGTKARIALGLSTYQGFGHTGVTLYINAIQIVELQEFGGDAESFGFDATDGFTGDDMDDDVDPFSDDEGDLDEETEVDDGDFDF